MRRGFSLIELLVASLLLGMLVTVLTMIFNSSAIAWRTGTAGVVILGDARRQLGALHDARDELLPGVGDGENAKYGTARAATFRTVSLWKKDSNQLRTDRAYDRVSWGTAPQVSLTQGRNGAPLSLQGGETMGGSLFTVGVQSAGPDGEYGTEDDITTWPDEVF